MRETPLPLALLTGAAWIAQALVGLTAPAYYSPETTLDYAAVVAYTLGLVLLGACVRTMRARAGRMSSAAASAAAAGLFTAGVANLLEDGFGMPVGWLYIAAVLTAILALIALCAALVRERSWRPAMLTAATLGGLFLVSTWLGGPILAISWAIAGAAARRGRLTPSLSPTP